MKLRSIARFIGLSTLSLALSAALHPTGRVFADGPGPKKKPAARTRSASARPAEFARYAIYAKTAPRAKPAPPVTTRLPLELTPDTRIVLVGNTLFERAQHFGYFEAALQTGFPEHRLRVRHLAWAADTPSLQPRPDNFADLEQHLRWEKADVILATYGFNESFAGRDGLQTFQHDLRQHLESLRGKAFNGRTAPRIVLVSPIANENVPGVQAADRNNARIAQYTAAMSRVADELGIAFVDLFTPTSKAMARPGTRLTINGCHLNDAGYRLLAEILYRALFHRAPAKAPEELVTVIRDKNRQFFRRYRPLNTFYYTGGRNKTYGYLYFLPAMRNFDLMVENRDRRIWEIAQRKTDSAIVDDSNIPPLPPVPQSRGANRWMKAEAERSEFKVDPRFEVNLFAGEEEFPDIAAPIQIRWDARGRLWVSCSTTYPHVYPGNEPNDKLVILEDTDGDGRADQSTVFADDLHIPLSFEFGDGGVYVSEAPHLTFLKDTDGDGKADVRRRLLSGFGTEDSHHSIHDFIWTPDGDLLIRESIFLHSQVETPYGPVRQRNSGWFRFEPRRHRLTPFGSYPSTNPWGVTFDDWGRHMASHPIYAQAFHVANPAYPTQHRRPTGLRAYSGTCGHEFIDFLSFPQELQGAFVKARYKPTNRIEILKWKRGDFGFDEEYVGDLIFSTNLSFIPVDIRFGPRGALYVCDWYNPIKGHMQYALRDTRRDRHSGRIWRITAKGRPLQAPPKIADATIDQLLDVLKRRESRYRYWARRELRERDPEEVTARLDRWVAKLDPHEPRFRHHQLEAIWVFRALDAPRPELLRELLECNNEDARAAAVKQIPFWREALGDAGSLLRTAAADSSGHVRMEAVLAASWLGTQAAFDAVLESLRHPYDEHLEYAIICSLESESLKRFWQAEPPPSVASLLDRRRRRERIRRPKRTRRDVKFDRQPNLKQIDIGCIPERMQYTVRQFIVRPGQPVKLTLTNPDATDHNLVITKPGALAEVGMAANEMARDPRNAVSDFIPRSKRDLILHFAPMIGPNRSTRIHVLRFKAPSEPGIYPYVCTFPGHWVVMNGMMVVARSDAEAEQLIAGAVPKVIRRWKLVDFPRVEVRTDEATVMAGMQAFAKARCNQCHVLAGHGVNLGPDLSDVVKRFKGRKLLQQILEPSAEIHKDFQTHQFLLDDGRVVSGVIMKETPTAYHVVTNLLLPETVTLVKKSSVEERRTSTISAMPEQMLDVLTREEILALLGFLESGGYKMPKHLKH